jgi:hypothetical protein
MTYVREHETVEHELNVLHERLAGLFTRAEPRRRSLAYLKGLLAESNATQSNARMAGNSQHGKAKLHPMACSTFSSACSGILTRLAISFATTSLNNSASVTSC